jgi:hypothetical protein
MWYIVKAFGDSWNFGTQGGVGPGFFLFFLAILWRSHHTGNHPQEELAKFGYRSERKVKKFKNAVIFLATCLEPSIV